MSIPSYLSHTKKRQSPHGYSPHRALTHGEESTTTQSPHGYSPHRALTHGEESTKKQSPHGYSPHRALTHGEESTTTRNPHMDTARIGLSHMGRKAQQHAIPTWIQPASGSHTWGGKHNNTQSPHGYSPHRALTHGEESTTTRNPHMDTARIGLSHMGRKAQQHAIPTWIQPASGSHTWGGKHNNTQSPHGYSPHRALTHGEESTTTRNPHMDTARIGLSHMGRKAQQHAIPTWTQPASGSHTWGGKHNNTQSPHGHSPHRALTHGEESTTTRNPHMDTARIGLSHMGRKAQQHAIPTWIQPASGSHTWGGKHNNTQSPHGYSPHRALTHGEESTTTRNPHMETARIGLSHMGRKAQQHAIPTWTQPASGSHTWGGKHNNTQSPHGHSPHRALTHGEESTTTRNPHMDTARIGLSHMGRKAQQHAIPTWTQPASGSHTWGGKHNTTQSPHGHSPHRALTHGEESTTTRNPHMDTARIGLSHMGRKAQQHAIPTWTQPASGSHTWGGKHNNTQSPHGHSPHRALTHGEESTTPRNPHMDTARIGLSHMGRKAQQHAIPTWTQPASGSHTWGGKHNNTQSPHGHSPHRALTHGEESTTPRNPHMDTARIGLSHMGRKAQQHAIPTWTQPASGSHTWGGKHNNTQSPHGHSPHRALTHGEESTTTRNPHMDTARIGLSHMGRKAQQHAIPTWIQPASGSHTWGGKHNNTQSPHGHSPHRALTHGEESTTTRNPHMDTARIGLSHMGRKAQQHAIPTWIQPASGSHTWGGKHNNTQSPHGYSPHRALTHGEESTTTRNPHMDTARIGLSHMGRKAQQHAIPTWIQPASGSHTWGGKHNNTQSPHGYSPHRALTHGEESTTTRNPHMDTARIGLSHMGRKAQQHAIPTWTQPASGSHTWGGKHNNTQSPHGYSPHRALTHGEESTTTRNPHMDTARIGLSHMGRKAQQHAIPTWTQPASGSHTWGGKHNNTQSPHGHSPHRALTHGEESTTTRNPHMDTARIGLSHMGRKAQQHAIPTWTQPASGSHTWGGKHNNTQSPHGHSPHRALTHGEESTTTRNPHMDTARIGLSHMGRKAQQHAIPTWTQPASGSHTWGGKHNNTQSPHGHSPHRALTHGEESTTTRNPHMDTARIGLSHMGRKAQQHAIPTWTQPASGSHTWGGKHNNTQSPHGYSPHRALTHGEESTTTRNHHMDTARIGLSHMGRKAQQHAIPTWIQPASGSHTWGGKHNNTQSHMDTARIGLSHMGRKAQKHNPHMDTARIGLSHMGRKAQKRNPHMDTARIGLSHMGRKAQQHAIPTWIQPASGSHTWGGKHNNTQSPHGYSPHRALTHGEESTTTRNPHMDTARIGLSHMGRKAQKHNPHMDTARIGLSHMGRKAQKHNPHMDTARIGLSHMGRKAQKHNPHMDTARIGLSHMGRKAQKHAIPTWIQPASGSHTWGGKHNNTIPTWIQPASGSHTWGGKHKNTQSPHGYSPHRALTHGEESTTTQSPHGYSPHRALTHGEESTKTRNPHMDTARIGLSHMGRKAQKHAIPTWIQPASGSHTWGGKHNNTIPTWIQPASGSHTWGGKHNNTQSPHGYSPHRALTHGEESTTTRNPHMDTARIGLSHMGRKAQQHAIPTWIQPASGSHTWGGKHKNTIPTWIQPASGSHTWEESTTHNPHMDTARIGLSHMGRKAQQHNPHMDTARIGLSHMGRKAQKHAIPTWIQPASGSHTWGGKHKNTQSPHGYSPHRALTHGEESTTTQSPHGYSPHRALTHGEESTTTRNPHMDTARIGLSHMGRKAQQHAIPTWIQPASGSHTWGGKHNNTQSPHGYSPHRALTHGEESTKTQSPHGYSPHRALTHGKKAQHTIPTWIQPASGSHTWGGKHKNTIPTWIQPASGSHTWGGKHNNTQSHMDTARIGLSHMGRKAQQHAIPHGYSPHRALTHGEESTTTRNPHMDTARIGLSHMGRKAQKHNPHMDTARIGLSHMGRKAQKHNPHMDTARIGLSHMGRKAQKHNPHMDTARIGLSHMGRKAQQHAIPTWIQPASGSHTWGGKHKNTQSPHGYSPHRALTHGEESTTTRNPHMDTARIGLSHMGRKAQKHNPHMDTARIGLSHMGRKAQQHAIPTWIQPASGSHTWGGKHKNTIPTWIQPASGSHTWGGKHKNTIPTWIQPASGSHTWGGKHKNTIPTWIQPASGSHTWGGKHNNTQSPHGYSPHRALTHGEESTTTRNPHMDTARIGLSHMGRKAQQHAIPTWIQPASRSHTWGGKHKNTIPTWIQPASGSHTWGGKHKNTIPTWIQPASGSHTWGGKHNNTQSPHGYSPHRALTHGEESTTTRNPHMDTARIGLSHMGRKAQQHAIPTWIQPASRSHTWGGKHKNTIPTWIQPASGSHTWGGKHKNTIPTWIQPASGSHTWGGKHKNTIPTWIQPASGSHTWGGKHNNTQSPHGYSPHRALTHGEESTTTRNSHMDTARIGLSHMGRKAQQHAIPTWIQPASGSHTWGGKHNTQSPHGYSPHRALTHGEESTTTQSTHGYSPHRALTHGEESTTHNPHMDTARIGLSHMGRKAQQHNPHMDTARIGLSHMGRKAQHTIPTWIQPASGSHTWGGKHTCAYTPYMLFALNCLSSGHVEWSSLICF